MHDLLPRIRPRFRRRGILFKHEPADDAVLMLFERPAGRTPVCVRVDVGFRPASAFHDAPGPARNIVATVVASDRCRSIVEWLRRRSC